ncbi:MFS transporter [Longirhabdus pacifica]|uniref:MFS transporter n=1 Tax=Longirhabdus pacifica TaxID=2305227 RepID=UPI00100897F0|nr:MFS transporter [Longirhabdus pacifica]
MSNVWILSLVSFFTDMGSYMVVPLIPLFLASSGPVIIGVIEGIAESMTSILKLWSGYMGDRRKNHKKMAVVGYGLSGIGRVILIIASSWIGVFIWKLVDRIGKGIRSAPRDALIAEAGGKKQGKSFGIHKMMDMLGAALGIGIAYFILVSTDEGAFQTVFIASMIPIVIGWLILLKVKRPNGQGNKEKQQQKKNKMHTQHPPISIWKSWRLFDRKLKQLLLVLMFFTLANSSNAFLLLRANELEVPLENTLLMFLVFHIIASLFSYITGSISDVIGSRFILTIGYITYALIYLLFGFSDSITTLWLGFALLGVYVALTKGVEKAVVARFAPANMKGTALGSYAMFTGVGLLPASLMMGLVWQWFGATIAFSVCAAIAFITAILIFIIIPTRSSELL